ncbi:hypothetical protein [Falsochrobactrum shanghaiense]|nr:hypothetical protein [Falsochrobactrum shanghaiense]
MAKGYLIAQVTATDPGAYMDHMPMAGTPKVFGHEAADADFILVEGSD